MAFTFDAIFAADPNNAANVASNASITIFDPADATKAPITITDPTDSPISNPITVNKNGFGPAFKHATLDRVAWSGGGFEGFFTSYEGIKNVAVAAQAAAEAAGADAAAAAAAGVADVATNAANAETAAEAAAASAAASAALVNAPADAAIATAINGTGTQTKAALSATYLPIVNTPAGITGGPFKGGFDKRTSIYNLKPSHLRRTRAGLGKARAGSGQARIAFIGDSTTGGVGATTISVDDWPARFGSILASAGFPLAGSGFIAGWKASAADTRWTIPSGWGALSGWSNLITNSTTANALVFTSTNAATTAAVHYANTGGVFTVSVDGGAPVTVTPSGAQNMGTYSVSGLANTTHTLSIVRTSGNVQIFGAEVGTGNGVRLCNAGIGGQKIVPAGSTGWFTSEAILTSASGFNADLVFLMMETNDTGVTAVSDYKTWMQGAITRIRNNGADLVLVTAVPSSGKDFTAYNQALYELADANDVPLIDLQDKMGTYTLINGYGLMLDGLHPTSAGYAEVARDIFTALAI